MHSYVHIYIYMDMFTYLQVLLEGWSAESGRCFDCCSLRLPSAGRSKMVVTLKEGYHAGFPTIVALVLFQLSGCHCNFQSRRSSMNKNKEQRRKAVKDVKAANTRCGSRLQPFGSISGVYLGAPYLWKPLCKKGGRRGREQGFAGSVIDLSSGSRPIMRFIFKILIAGSVRSILSQFSETPILGSSHCMEFK